MNNQEESHIVYVKFEEWLELIQTIGHLTHDEVERLRHQWNECSPMVPVESVVAAADAPTHYAAYGDNLSVWLRTMGQVDGILSLYTRQRDWLLGRVVLTVPSVPSPHTQENEVRTCEDLHSTPVEQCQTDTALVPDVASIQQTLRELENRLEDLDAVFELLDLQAQRDRTYLEHRLDYLETTVARVLHPLCDKPRKKSKKARASSKTSSRRPVRKGRRAKA